MTLGRSPHKRFSVFDPGRRVRHCADSVVGVLEPPESYRVIRDAGIDPASDPGVETFASLFGARPGNDAVRRLPVTLPARTHLTTHRHTADVAACVTAGAMTFVFGAGGNDRVELQPGDYIWIQTGVMHDEETADGVALIVAHVEPFETLED